MHLNRTMRHLLLALPLLAGVGLVACSSSDDEPTAEPTATAMMEMSPVASEAGLTITEAWARATPGNPDENSAAYMLITNAGSDDRLVRAEVDDDLASAVELHETVMEDDQMRMHPVEGWDVPGDGGTLELSQGANHVMMIGLSQQLVEGDTVGLTLHFEHAGAIHFEVPVREGMPMDSMN